MRDFGAAAGCAEVQRRRARVCGRAAQSGWAGLTWLRQGTGLRQRWGLRQRAEAPSRWQHCFFLPQLRVLFSQEESSWKGSIQRCEVIRSGRTMQSSEPLPLWSRGRRAHLQRDEKSKIISQIKLRKNRCCNSSPSLTHQGRRNAFPSQKSQHCRERASSALTKRDSLNSSVISSIFRSADGCSKC